MKVDYPSAKRRTAQTTEKMREAEKNLDMFWKAVDDHYERNTGQTLHGLLSSVLTSREVERTAEWSEPLVSITQDAAIRATTDGFSILDIEERTQRTIAAEAPEISVKTKVKTRGQAAEPANENAVAEDIVNPATPKITVGKRAHKLFSTLFYNPTQGPLPGEIPWAEFLHALSTSGFSVQKQYGSAWLFAPVNGQRPILIHEPHPSGKIGIQTARRIGRRLTRTYGWTSETFIVES